MTSREMREPEEILISPVLTGLNDAIEASLLESADLYRLEDNTKTLAELQALESSGDPFTQARGFSPKTKSMDSDQLAILWNYDRDTWISEGIGNRSGLSLLRFNRKVTMNFENTYIQIRQQQPRDDLVLDELSSEIDSALLDLEDQTKEARLASIRKILEALASAANETTPPEALDLLKNMVRALRDTRDYKNNHLSRSLPPSPKHEERMHNASNEINGIVNKLLSNTGELRSELVKNTRRGSEIYEKVIDYVNDWQVQEAINLLQSIAQIRKSLVKASTDKYQEVAATADETLEELVNLGMQTLKEADLKQLSRPELIRLKKQLGNFTIAHAIASRQAEVKESTSIKVSNLALAKAVLKGGRRLLPEKHPDCQVVQNQADALHKIKGSDSKASLLTLLERGVVMSVTTNQIELFLSVVEEVSSIGNDQIELSAEQKTFVTELRSLNLKTLYTNLKSILSDPKNNANIGNVLGAENMRKLSDFLQTVD